MEVTGNKKIGAVLVQGGGIAGIQASLDLANSGFKVYLIERSSAIGGMMSHLDKTFPTGDCATCIVSPKLVECARNLNIEILTLSELMELKGDPGNFKATIKTHPRYIDESKCTACGQCTEACPVNIPNEFDRNLGTRKAIAKRYAQATPNLYNIIKTGHSPCKVACPANINVQGYIQLIKKKEYLKAVNLIRERNPLSGICGRVCTHPCEAACTRGFVDSAVAIRLLKRFASDREMELVESGKIILPEEKRPHENAKKVAVVGAGPAGLTVADDLAGRGFAVTIYEATSQAGGMLRWGIPDYRLPAKILDYEVDLIRRKGVEFKYNSRLGDTISIEKLRAEHDAVFLGLGLQISRNLNIEGEDKAGIYYGVEFLKRSNSKDNLPVMKEKVVVIGGGNVAVDVARTALRLGAKHVEMVCLEQRDEMPALPEEIHATLDEGIGIYNGWGPKRILGTGKVEGIELKRCTSVFDQDKRFYPSYDEDDLITLSADQIIIAIGQSSEKEVIEGTNLEINRGCFNVDTVTLETSVKGIFAGGDSASGSSSVIEAVASGKRAAESIARYLKNEGMLTPRFEDLIKPVPEVFLPSTKDKEKKERVIPGDLSVEQRINNFLEIESSLDEKEALLETERCLNCALCSECMECVKICEQSAVNHSMTERIRELEIGSVILAPGFEEFDATKKGEFGFNRYPNVLTSVQFERMLSASGPFEGHIIRRSDGKEAKRVAWLQCVGSRDAKCGNEYCSSVCCMVSTKQAIVAIDHTKDVKATIFYMDIRAHGKDFDQYYERAKSNPNINYIKNIPSRIVQLPESKDLRVRFYNGESKMEELDFDLVVLSVGMEPGASVIESAKRIGVELNEYGFCATKRLSPLSTSRQGVFVAGAFQEPKDIPETVTQASAAASMAMEMLVQSRNSLVTKKVYPDESDITDEQPRIGVFVCHCGKNIASVVDVEKVAHIAAQEPDVVFTTHTMYTCSDTSLKSIKEMITEHRLNRVVVASCTPRTHEPLFRETLREVGLNPYLFELANIRDQCSWVHSSAPELATEKAVELVKMSIARARFLSPLQGTTIPVNQSGLVIGGGISGITAALALAEQGFKTTLIERTKQLGGQGLALNRTLEGDDVASFVSDTIERVSNHPNIKVLLGVDITGVGGHIGNFEVKCSQGNQRYTINCGAIIVATGAIPSQTDKYLRGKSNRVLTQLELQKRLDEKTFVPGKNVVMIQCVGSRNEEHLYCSRICCSMAVNNALRIKKIYPDTNIYVLYRDIRTYGFREKYYQEAREAGIIFMRYEKDFLPDVVEDSDLIVKLNSPDYPEDIEIDTDNLVLSTGMEVAKDNRQLADMLKVPLNEDGFFVEAHLKLRPVDFTTEGIYLCGLAHSPKMVDENISQARAAAARAATLLCKSSLEVGAQVSVVDQSKCISCMTCVRACPYSAPAVNVDRKAEIVAAKCMGCGICVSECPAHAIQLHHFETKQFATMLDELFEVQKRENKHEVQIYG